MAKIPWLSSGVYGAGADPLGLDILLSLQAEEEIHREEEVVVEGPLDEAMMVRAMEQREVDAKMDIVGE
jgi:hypothetical protein